ncbi:MAG: hypothetical protein DBX55_07965 [Verrucomicrobia bacterium]|nr:MAG: hypothetical protein DBX55_07965 [Verrucomicrobiota bacterium]
MRRPFLRRPRGRAEWAAAENAAWRKRILTRAHRAAGRFGERQAEHGRRPRGFEGRYKRCGESAFNARRRGSFFLFAAWNTQIIFSERVSERVRQRNSRMSCGVFYAHKKGGSKAVSFWNACEKIFPSSNPDFRTCKIRLSLPEISVAPRKIPLSKGISTRISNRIYKRVRAEIFSGG